MAEPLRMYFSIRTAARLGGIPPRRLARWVKEGVIQIDGGLFTFVDLVVIRTLVRLRTERVSLQEIKRAASTLSNPRAWASAVVGILNRKIYFGKNGKFEGAISKQIAAAEVVRVARVVQEATALANDSRTRQRDEIGKIVATRGICHGKPRFAGTRIPVHVIQGYIAANWAVGDILREYPALKAEDVAAAKTDIPTRRKRA